MDGVDPALAPCSAGCSTRTQGRPAATAVAAALTRIAGDAAAVDGDAIPEEGTVVMATAVPSRAAGAVVEPVAIGSIPPVDPGPRSEPLPTAAGPLAAPNAIHPRSRIAPNRGIGLPAPAMLAVGLVLLAAVVIGATAFGRPATGEEASPPAITVEATTVE